MSGRNLVGFIFLVAAQIISISADRNAEAASFCAGAIVIWALAPRRDALSLQRAEG